MVRLKVKPSVYLLRCLSEFFTERTHFLEPILKDLLADREAFMLGVLGLVVVDDVQDEYELFSGCS